MVIELFLIPCSGGYRTYWYLLLPRYGRIYAHLPVRPHRYSRLHVQPSGLLSLADGVATDP